MHPIDLRSDTVTRPTQAMREVMYNAEVGDDVYGDDPSVNQLETQAAERFGFEEAIFCTSGTQANLIALMCHCQRGDEYIVGQQAHTYKYEAGGAAVLGSIQPQPLNHQSDGSLDLDEVSKVIKVNNIHFAKTRLLCLENTFSGQVLAMQYLAQARSLVDKHGLLLHLDGARIFNAAVKLGIPVSAIARHFDSVAFCLSKGLGAPAGSMLCASSEVITEARRWRKMLGGGMRQTGFLAAAALYALDHHVERLAEDHRNAEQLAAGLATIKSITIDLERLQTNMVFVQLPEQQAVPLAEFLGSKGILISPGSPLRLVLHLDISAEDVTTVIDSINEFFART